MTLLRCKVAIVGDCKVGKTSLINVTHKGKQYSKNYVMTSGVDLSVKTVKIPDTPNTLVELYLFDTSGHALYQDLRAKYWQGSQLLMLLYDVTSRDSFQALQAWIMQAKKCMPFAGSKKEGDVMGVLVAAKCDQYEYAQVTQQEALAFAHQNQLAFFETAAATGKDVDIPFNFLAAKFHEFYEKKLQETKKAQE